jgi:hypothetical protein
MRFLLRFLVPSLALVAACGGSTDSAPAVNDVPPSAPAKAAETNDGRRAAPSSPPTWCTTAGAHDLCADFDGENPFEPFDDVSRGNDRNQKDLDELMSSERSSPNALRVRGNDITTEAQSESNWVWSGTLLSKKLPTTTSTKATIAFDLYVAKAKEHTGVLWMSGYTGANDTAFRVSLDVAADGTWLSTSGGTLENLPPVPQNQWVRVEISLDDNGGSGGIAALAFDGENAGTVPFEGSLAASAETTLYLGVSRSAPSPAYDLRYDNVIVDLK